MVITISEMHKIDEHRKCNAQKILRKNSSEMKTMQALKME